jgi:hypothetical protein
MLSEPPWCNGNVGAAIAASNITAKSVGSIESEDELGPSIRAFGVEGSIEWEVEHK